MKLNNTVIDTAKPLDKPYKLSDCKGLYLLIMPNGSKYFRLDYRFESKRKTLAIGVYPEIDLDTARSKRDTAKQQIKNGIDPSSKRNTENIPQIKDGIDIEFKIGLINMEEVRQRDNELGRIAAMAAFSKNKKQDTAQIEQKDYRSLYDEAAKKISDLQGKNAALLAFSDLTPSQKEKLFAPNSPALEKLKELVKLRVNPEPKDIQAFTDDELQKELERRGYSVSSYTKED